MLFMRSVTALRTLGIRYLADNTASRSSQFPISTVTQKSVDDVLEPPKIPTNIRVSGEKTEPLDLSGVPIEFVCGRRVRVYRPSRAATQSGWANTRAWKIELDNMERWENPLIGWSSTGDPLSNITMAMDFASKEDAIQFCDKYNLKYEVIEPNERKFVLKTYAENFSWNKRTRITNK